MTRSRLPFICVVNAVAADITIVARSATFVQAFIQIDLAPDSDASHFLTHRVGKVRRPRLAR